MPDFRQANPGDPLAIGAADWNAAMDAARAYERLGRTGGGFPGGPLTPALDVLVRNDTGGGLAAFAPVKLGATVTGLAADPVAPFESRDRPLFEGLECDGSGVVAVLQEDTPADEIGRAVVLGCTVARVPAGTAEGAAVGGPASGNAGLVAADGYAVLLTDAVGAGADAMALVLVGGGGGTSGPPRYRLDGPGDDTPGAKSRALLTRYAGYSSWEDVTPETAVWLVEPNGGVLPDLTDGRAYHAVSTGRNEYETEVETGDKLPVYEAIVPPGVMTDWQCVDGTPEVTQTPVGVG